jgi:hypothetical protein
VSDELGEVGEHPQAAVADGVGHGRADAERGELHHEAGELEHRLRERLAELQSIGSRAPRFHLGQRDAEQDRENHDLQHVVGGGSLEEAFRHKVLDDAERVTSVAVTWPAAEPAGGRISPSPGWHRLTAARPITSASVVTSSK